MARIRYSYTYILFCQEESSGAIYLKIGRTMDPIKRADQIKTSCPFKLQEMWIASGSRVKHAGRLEIALHHRFKLWRTKGEWFRFDPAVPEHKTAFHVGIHEELARIMPEVASRGWTKLNILEYQKELDKRRFLARRKALIKQAVLRRMGITAEDEAEMRRAA